MKKAAITGATGFLGTHLACYLRSVGMEVLCLQRSQSYGLFDTIAKHYGYSSGDFLWQRADILDSSSLLDAFTGCEVVFHCAARVSFEKKDAPELFETNVEGTRNVCNACIKAGNIPLIYASSVAALGRKPGASSISENEEWVDSPYNTDYATSKHLAEMEVWRSQAEGLPVSVVNPGIILGTGDGKTGSNAIFRHVKSGSRFYPSGTNGFVGVKDVCRAMYLMYSRNIRGTRILLVAETLSYQNLLQQVATRLGVRPPSVALRGFMLRLVIFVAKTCEKLHLPFPFPSQGLRSTSFHSHYVSQNLSALENFAFTPVSEVLEETAVELKL